MTKTEEYAEFLGKTAYYAALIVICSYVGASLARAEVSPVGPITEVAPVKAPNLIIEPDYETRPPTENETEHSDTKSEKLQYEPVTEELPILEPRKGPAAEKHGSHYEEGSELYVTPEPGITPKEEAIEETTEDAAEPSSEPKGAF